MFAFASSALLYLFFTSDSAGFVGVGAKIFLPPVAGYPCYAADHAMSVFVTS